MKSVKTYPIDLVLYVFKSLGFNDFVTQISLRDPENKQKYIGDDEAWNKAENAILLQRVNSDTLHSYVNSENGFWYYYDQSVS